MSKFRKYFYIVVLAFTILVASPLIYSKIWENSEIKFMFEKNDGQDAVIPPEKNIGEITSTVPEISQTDITTTSPVETQPPESALPKTDNENIPSLTEPPRKNETAPANEPEPHRTDTSEPEQESVSQNIGDRIITFGSAADDSYFDDALFIGDSRMVGIDEYGDIDNADYFCSVGLASYKIDKEDIDGLTFSEMLSSKTYGKIYIMAGINEAGNYLPSTEKAFKSMIDEIRAAQPDAPIYLMANLQVTTSKSSEGYITNDMINNLNTSLKMIAGEYGERVYYLDINDSFELSDGTLNPDITGDGVHIYAKYYLEWCQAIRDNTVVYDSMYDDGIY